MIKLFWGTTTSELNIGNLYGYRVHSETLKRFIAMREDVQIVENLDDADCALYITTPEVFVKRPPITTFLFTMFEGVEIPQLYIDNIQNADYLLTPSKWTKELFSKYFDPEKIFVVPHGVEPEFRFTERVHHPRLFRYLWVGAPNPRKGYQEVTLVWDALKWEKDPNVELYMKTTRTGKIEHRRNVTLDGRDISRKDLIKLYHSAHCFIFPTRGEGFGLTLAEAMATGLPCIATEYSGVTEFFDKDVGYPIGYKLGDAEIKSPILKDMGKTQVAYPDMEELGYWMMWVRQNYKRAITRGWNGSLRIKRNFKWEMSAEKLATVLNAHGGNHHGTL